MKIGAQNRPMKAVKQIGEAVSTIDGVTFEKFKRERRDQTLFHIMYKNDVIRCIIGSVVYLTKSKTPRIQVRSPSYYGPSFESGVYYVRKDGSINTTTLIAKVQRWAAKCKIKEITNSLQKITYEAEMEKSNIIGQILKEQLVKHGHLKLEKSGYDSRLRLNKKSKTVLEIDLEEYDEENDPFIKVAFNLLEIDLGNMVSIMCLLAKSLAKKKEKAK